MDIFNGVKTVEFRRRRLRIADQTPAWIYAKHPLAAVLGSVTIAEIVTRSPATIWRRFGTGGGISKREFLEYFDGCNEAHALLLQRPLVLQAYVTLQALRKIDSSFQPPQFFVRLANGTLHTLLLRSKSQT
jgi:predicted transcriptional regulator